jgi:hypothetical protein
MCKDSTRGGNWKGSWVVGQYATFLTAHCGADDRFSVVCQRLGSGRPPKNDGLPHQTYPPADFGANYDSGGPPLSPGRGFGARSWCASRYQPPAGSSRGSGNWLRFVSCAFPLDDGWPRGRRPTSVGVAGNVGLTLGSARRTGVSRQSAMRCAGGACREFTGASSASAVPIEGRLPIPAGLWIFPRGRSLGARCVPDRQARGREHGRNSARTNCRHPSRCAMRSGATSRRASKPRSRTAWRMEPLRSCGSLPHGVCKAFTEGRLARQQRHPLHLHATVRTFHPINFAVPQSIPTCGCRACGAPTTPKSCSADGCSGESHAESRQWSKQDLDFRRDPPLR